MEGARVSVGDRAGAEAGAGRRAGADGRAKEGAGAGMGEARGTASEVDAGVGKAESAGAGMGLGGCVGAEVGAGSGVDMGEVTGARASAGEAAGWDEDERAEARWEAAVALVQLAGATTRAGSPSHLKPGPDPLPYAGWSVRMRPGTEGRREETGEGGSVDRPDVGVQWVGGGTHHGHEMTVEEKLRVRRMKFRAAAGAKASSGLPPGPGAGSGSGGEYSAGAGGRGGGGAGRKRKAPAERAFEAERAEKVRREVQWAQVRAAVCGVLRRAARKRAGRRRASGNHTGGTAGTALNANNDAAAPSELETVTVQEGIMENRPKRKCQEVPPGTYAPIKRAKGMPPGRPPDPPPLNPPQP